MPYRRVWPNWWPVMRHVWQLRQIRRPIFLPEGAPITVGTTLRNPAYAQTLAAFADQGAAAFYGGAVGKQIIAAVQGATGNPGVLSEMDLAIYQVKERAAVCAPYRGHEVCGMGPPSSGAVAVGQILGLLEGSGPECRTA